MVRVAVGVGIGIGGRGVARGGVGENVTLFSLILVWMSGGEYIYMYILFRD